jgi:hypothetical protein
MHKQIFVCIFFILLYCGIHAQDTSRSKLRFESTAQIGFVEGQMGTSAQLQLVNGIRFKYFSAGIGVGLDYYAMRSIPLFIDLKKDILKNGKSPFIYADAGVNFPWKTRSFEWVSDTDAGIFYELGVGHRFPVKSHAIMLSLGYSFKSYAHEEVQEVWCLVPPCPVITQHFDFKLRRLSVKAGFSF